MSWLLASPGHQQPWYWFPSPWIFLFHYQKSSLFFHFWKCKQVCFSFPLLIVSDKSPCYVCSLGLNTASWLVHMQGHGNITVISHEHHGNLTVSSTTCLYHSSCRLTTKKMSKDCITGPLWLVDSPHKGPVMWKAPSCHGIMFWADLNFICGLTMLHDSLFLGQWHLTGLSLTPKHRETHGCIVSTVATDALVLKHQVISILNAD